MGVWLVRTDVGTQVEKDSPGQQQGSNVQLNPSQARGARRSNVPVVGKAQLEAWGIFWLPTHRCLYPPFCQRRSISTAIVGMIITLTMLFSELSSRYIINDKKKKFKLR